MAEDEFEDPAEDDVDRGAESILRLGHVLDDRYVGDHRFGLVELDEPGQLEGEDFRLRLGVDDQTHFFVSVLPDEGFVRVGLATADVAVSDSIEAVILKAGGSPTEYVARAMDAEDELDYEVQQFHDDVYYFCSDLPFERPEELLAKNFREEIVTYLEGYIDAFLELVEED